MNKRAIRIMEQLKLNEEYGLHSRNSLWVRSRKKKLKELEK